MRQALNDLFLLLHGNVGSPDSSALQIRRQKRCLDRRNLPENIYPGKSLALLAYSTNVASTVLKSVEVKTVSGRKNIPPLR